MALPEGLDAVGEAGSPPPPWTLALEGLVWLHRATGAPEPGVEFDHSVPVTVAGFARYVDSPVGPYDEVWGSPTLIVRGRGVSLSVAFMAVDSLASLRGGRANWALPKEMATFTPDGWEATGEGWTIGARVLSRGARMPIRLGGHLLQASAGGDLLRSSAVVRGFARPARVRVEVAGTAAPPWLTPGRHLGLTLDRATLTVRAPRSLEGR